MWIEKDCPRCKGSFYCNFPPNSASLVILLVPYDETQRGHNDGRISMHNHMQWKWPPVGLSLVNLISKAERPLQDGLRAWSNDHDELGMIHLFRRSFGATWWKNKKTQGQNRNKQQKQTSSIHDSNQIVHSAAKNFIFHVKWAPEYHTWWDCTGKKAKGIDFHGCMKRKRKTGERKERKKKEGPDEYNLRADRVYAGLSMHCKADLELLIALVHDNQREKSKLQGERERHASYSLWLVS